MHPSYLMLLVPLLTPVERDTPAGFSCSGRLHESAPTVRFSVVVGFGLDGVLTVLGPDGRPKLDYWNDVAPGEIALENALEEPMIWTGLSGKRATLAGFGVRSDGSLFALTINSSKGATRPFSMYDSHTGQILTGECR
jgi:hypothetical protein